MKQSDQFTGESMVLDKLPAYFLFIAIFWIGWQLMAVLQPFLMVLIFSAIVASITFPIYAKLEFWFKGRKSLASLVTCLLVMFAIVIPLIIFLLILTRQAVDLYRIINNYLVNVDLTTILKWDKGNMFYDLSGPYASEIATLVQQNADSLKTALTESAKFISTFAAQQSAKILTDLGLSIFNLLLMFFTLFYLYKDGRYVLRRMMMLSPIPVKHERVIYRKFNEISKATLFGTFLTAITQGVVGWIGFAIAGVPSAFFWGTAVAIFSLVPTVGTAFVWLPIGLIMLLGGNWWGAFVLIWGFSLISTVDNVLRIIFIGTTSKINSLLVFITVFGGMIAFGLIGVIFGPMLLVIFFTLLHIYELEYRHHLGNEEELGLNDPDYVHKEPQEPAF